MRTYSGGFLHGCYEVAGVTPMSTIQSQNAPRQVHDPFLVAGDAASTAEAITLHGAEAATLLSRPREVARLWVEDEYEELTREQAALWRSQTAADTRKPAIRRAGLELQATELAHAVAGSRELLISTRSRYESAQSALAPFRRRAVGSKRWYQAVKAVMFVGDLAGFATAALWLGELPLIAFTLAASAAAATIVAGLIGAEYSDLRRQQLRQRSVEELTSEQAPFRHLFTESGGSSGAVIMKRVLLLSIGTALMVSVGIGALRAAVDDPLVGVIFAGIALAVAGGSFLVSYAGADEIADLVDLYHTDYQVRQKQHMTLAADQIWRDWAESGAEESSLQDEALSHGEASSSHMQALKWRVLRNNPSVAGHGSPHGEPVGRAVRKEGQQP